MATTPTITIVPGRRACSTNVVINGYRYTNDKKRGDRTYMKCVLANQGCRARIVLVNGSLVSPVPVHPTHDVQFAETYVHVAKQTLKKNASQTDRPTKLLVAEAVNGMNFETRTKLNCQLSSLGKMCRLSRQTSRNHPTSPRSLKDLSLPPEYIHSSSGESLLLWDSGYTAERRRSFLFGTPANTSTLMEADHLVIDGTFKSAPQLMTQMVGIHGIFDSGWHFPLAYGLLPGKTQTLYSSLLENLDTFGPYHPQSVLCDYEFALHNAIAHTWPSATVRGCYFHYSQALWRRLQREDLVPEYQVENSPIRKAFKMIKALPFVPEDFIHTAWRNLKPTLPDDMRTFIDYFEHTWVGTSYSEPLFPHSRWNQHDATALLLPRSSNIAEGWHHGFHTLLSCSNPTIWKFLSCLKNEQDITDVKITKMKMREQPEPRAAKWRRYDERLQNIISNFNSYPTSTIPLAVLDFLKCVGCLM